MVSRVLSATYWTFAMLWRSASHQSRSKRRGLRCNNRWCRHVSWKLSIEALSWAANGVASMIRLEAALLKPILARHLGSAGVDRESLDHVVDSLMQTSLRGVDSHGIQLFPHYVRAARAGRINVAPRITIEDTGASTAILDADHAFGHRAGADAIDHAVDLATKTGVGAVSVRHSSHFGAAAYFALRAADRGFIGFAFTNADSLVKAFNAQKAVFGTNPICFTAPLEDEGPLCLDLAT